MARREEIIGVQRTENSGALGYFYLGTQGVEVFRDLRRTHGGTEGAKKELRRIFERGLELLQETTEHFDREGL